MVPKDRGSFIFRRVRYADDVPILLGSPTSRE
jgi:hypothetical protein